jgi:ABC-type branched-subunit amino acid transport system substrate-binding protein
MGASFTYHFLDFSEWQASQLPDGASVWTSVPFVASDDRPAVREFVARARRHAGSDLVTHVAFTHYTAVHALKVAIERAGSTSGDRVRQVLEGMELDTVTGPVRIAGGYASWPMYVAQAAGGRLQVVRRFDAVPPGAACA